MKRETFDLLLLISVVTLMVGTILLTGCGGGEPEEDKQSTTIPVNCQADPKPCV